jgi:glucokinase
MTILAGDVGGTKTVLAIVEPAGGSFRSLDRRVFASQDFRNFSDIVDRFFRDTTAGAKQRIERACISVAGPVIGGRCKTTNLPWNLDARTLAADLNVENLSLINDLEANAYGIFALGAEDVITIRPGAPSGTGNCAVISAGTGLGEAGMVWDGHRHLPFACEGGHASFAPESDLQVELWHFLKREFETVSVERVLSGPGLYNIYRFLKERNNFSEPQWLAEKLQSEDDPSPVISQAALANKCQNCSASLDLFVSIYGGEAANLALKTMATGGVYLGGGIAPKIMGRLQGPLFTRAFTGKGRMKPLLEAIAVHVILNQDAALLGAARYAAVSEPQHPVGEGSLMATVVTDYRALAAAPEMALSGVAANSAAFIARNSS